MKGNKKNEELQNKKEEGRKKLEAIKKADDEAWKELKTGVEKAFDNIKNAFSSAVNKFK